MKRTARLRALFEAPEILVLPGAYDALSAKLAERAGFEAVIVGGFSVTSSLLAAPNSSQLVLIELAEHYRRICDAVEVPVFVDADTGFGNVSNARRTIREFERAGVAGFFIEDQVLPKRCGHTPWQGRGACRGGGSQGQDLHRRPVGPGSFHHGANRRAGG